MEDRIKELRVLLNEVKDTSLRSAASTLMPLFFHQVVNDLLCVMSPNGVFALVSNSWEVHLGWKIEDLVGKNYLDFVYPDDRGDTGNAFKRYNFGDETLNQYYFNRYIHKSGSYRWLKWEPSIHKVFEHAGFIMGVATIVKDTATIQALEKAHHA